MTGDPVETEVPEDINGSTPRVNKNDLILRPVSQDESGEGLPYAPENWPNPGDNWSWRVGKRVTLTGHFLDRYLFPPCSIWVPENSPSKRQGLASKLSVERFIQSVFPDTEVDTFFASFSWKIPAKVSSSPQGMPLSVRLEVTSLEESEKVENETGEVHDKTSIKRKRNAGRGSLLVTPRRRTRQSFKTIISSSSNKNDDIIDLCSLNEETICMSNSKVLEDSSCSETDQVSNPEIKASPHHTGVSNGLSHVNGRKLDPEVPEESLGKEIREDFDEYLRSLDEILASSISETPLSATTGFKTFSEEEMAEYRNKLSSLLIMDFPSLASSENLPDMAALASKIQEDPNLSVDQLIKLKLIEEIPLIGKAFLATREMLQECDEFTAGLDANKAKASSLKKEYEELKENSSKLQDEIDSSTLVLEDIENQLAELESRREEISSAIESKKKTNLELVSAQNMVANIIPEIVREVKEAYSKKSEWEMKRTTLARRESEILAKVASVKRYFLEN